MNQYQKMQITHDYFTPKEWGFMAKAVVNAAIPKKQKQAILEKMPSTAALIAGHQVTATKQKSTSNLKGEHTNE